MRSLKQRKHKKNNSLKRYKRKNSRRVSFGNRKKMNTNKMNVMRGGVNNEITPKDGEFDFSGKNLAELKKFKGDLDELKDIFDEILKGQSISLELINKVLKYYDFDTADFFNISDVVDTITIKDDKKDKIQLLKNDLETIIANVDAKVINTSDNIQEEKDDAIEEKDDAIEEKDDAIEEEKEGDAVADEHDIALDNEKDDEVVNQLFDNSAFNFKFKTDKIKTDEEVKQVIKKPKNEFKQYLNEKEIKDLNDNNVNEYYVEFIKEKERSEKERAEKERAENAKQSKNNPEPKSEPTSFLSKFFPKSKKYTDLKEELSNKLQTINALDSEEKKVEYLTEFFNAKIEDNKNEYDKLIKDKEKTFGNSIMSLSDKNKNLTDEKKVLAGENATLILKNKAEIEKINKENEANIRKLNYTWGRKNTELKNEKDEEITKLKNEKDAEIALIKNESEKARNKIETENNKQIDKLNSTHKSEIKTHEQVKNNLNQQIESHKKDKNDLNEKANNLTNDIKTITDERDAFERKITTDLLKRQNKIIVSLDEKPFYTDICKNIKNIIVNAYFMDMLFDKQLESKPETSDSEGSEKGVQPSNTLSPAEKERQDKIKEMKSMILEARGTLLDFLTELVKQLNLPEDILTGVNPMDQLAKGALIGDMSSYLFAAQFFSVMAIGGKGKVKKGKTLKSLGLRKKKQSKSIRSIMTMKGGLDSKADLDDLIKKVMANIFQQMGLTENLLSYIQDKQINMESFEQSLSSFTSVNKMINGSNKIEPITNFLVPYKESPSEDDDHVVQEFIDQIKEILKSKGSNPVVAEEGVTNPVVAEEGVTKLDVTKLDETKLDDLKADDSKPVVTKEDVTEADNSKPVVDEDQNTLKENNPVKTEEDEYSLNFEDEKTNQ